MASLLRDPARYLDQCRARYGHSFQLRLPGVARTVQFLNEADDVTAVFRLRPHQYTLGNNRIMEPFLGESSLMFLPINRFKTVQKAVAPIIRDADSHRETVHQEVLEALNHWEQGHQSRVLSLAKRVTVRVILRRVLGLGPGSLRDKLEETLPKVLRESVYFPPLRFRMLGLTQWDRFLQGRAKLDSILYNIISEARHRPDSASTVLRSLLEAEFEPGRLLTDREVRDQVATLLFAGFDTTALSIAWIQALLIRNPTSIERVRDEAQGKTLIEQAQTDTVRWIVREALRLRPVVVFFTRTLQHDMQLERLDLVKSTTIALSPWLCHRDAKQWPDPEAFRPERWRKLSAPPCSWFPFGGGSRKCLGQTLAEVTMQTVITAMTRTLDLKPVPGFGLYPVRRGAFLTAPGGVPVTVTRRLSKVLV